MNKTLIAVTTLAAMAASGAAPADTLKESWGGAGRKFTHPGTLRVVSAGGVPRMVFDLSALPKGAKVHHASLFCAGGQPREPIAILITEKLDAEGKCVAGGKPLELEAPWFTSFDATEAVRKWAADPAGNLGFAGVSFSGPAASCVLEICYEGGGAGGTPVLRPPQAEGLKVSHHDGQTFLIWKEVPAYRPPANEILWVQRMVGWNTETTEPGEGVKGFPRAAAVTLKTLRDLEGLAVRGKPVGTMRRDMAPFVRLREVPEVRYRVYRHNQKITAATIHQAELIGQADAMCAYQDGFVNIASHGEYYDPYEKGDSVIPTWSVGAGQPVLPGEAYYVHTPAADGKCFYAVTTVQNGTENVGEFSDANSLAAPVEEKKSPPQPQPQWVTVNKTRYGQTDATEYWFAYWLAPPLANLPDNRPRRVVVAIPDTYKQPGPMVLNTHAGMGPGWKVDNIQSLYLHVEQDVSYGGDLCYNQGRGTLRSFRQCKVDYYSDRYVTGMVEWTLGKWKVDRARITSSVGTHYGIRHPELFPILWFGPYEVDFDQKWNPASGSLAGRLGPPDLAMTVDGHRAWDAFNIAWYLPQNPGKDIPFFVSDVGGKESGHAVEYGWQDDGKGLSALRDSRQPFLAHWGGGAISREVAAGLAAMSWTTSVPAFSNCSLDGSPGNGDPSDGDPWGQMNGFLFWQPSDVVDERDRWEMTVYLTADCFEDACTVDLTPRHCRQFRPAPGDKFRWTNTALDANKAIQTDEIAADKWGLATLKQITVSKGKNRIVIVRK